MRIDVNYVAAVGGGLVAGLLVIGVACLCHKTHRSRFRCRRSAIRSSIRRASLYLSNTNPFELSVAELLFNLTGGTTVQPQQPQTASSTLNKRLSSPPSAHNAVSTDLPPSHPPPPPPTHKLARRQRSALSQSAAEERVKVRRERKNVPPGMTKEGPVGVYQSSTEMVTVTPRSRAKPGPKPPSRESIVAMKTTIREHRDHAAIHRTDIGVLEHSSRGKRPHHLTSQPAQHSGPTWHSSGTLPLPAPPAESPDIFATFISTIKSSGELGNNSTPKSHSLGSRSRRVPREVLRPL
ncbi:serine/arginine repetitive matrix protein 1-like [Eriocheir sinensis]|uniref:serine/arginine repetitive matrix protein 1-like n=1 Tax=Eriocheir sinensis TaxID=95602 RepID=UPI0021C69365|nr:serine/arginine repetitive matrix protein 1-like [Eriocheir sinensis]